MGSESVSLVPNHLGIIMDGNGRWATLKRLPRSEGHKEGLKVAKVITKAASDLGVGVLSLFVFSTENWKRAEQEVSFLMFLLKSHLLKEWDFYRENKIRVVHSGDLTGLPIEVQTDLLKVAHDTDSFGGLTVNLAINYGGRDEIIRAVNRWKASDPESDLTTSQLEQFLDQPQLPPVDLLIRTAGEMRLSNFQLWQTAYSEFVFHEKFWPDWTPSDLEASILAYQSRTRRFGGHDEGVSE